MPRKVPYSGKSKKRQLQERKARKKDGPKYLADWSDDDVENNAPASEQTGACKSGAAKTDPLDSRDAEKMNLQPERKSGHVSVNNFRLQFLKESDAIIDKRKREAKRAVKRLLENDLEYSFSNSYPADFNLDLPKRPTWSYNISKQQLEKQEKEYFQEYLSTIVHQPQSRDLSYFELNLENWRQLWRVIEMSDILLIIADIRYPVLHISPPLLHYLQHTLHKPVIFIINKIDFVPPLMAVAWKRYLHQQFPGIQIVLFSSSLKINHHRSSGDGKKNKSGSGKNSANDNSNDKDAAESNDRDKHDDVDNDDVPLDFDPSKTMFKRPAKGSTSPFGPFELYKAVTKIVQDKVDMSSWRQHLEQEGIYQGEDKAVPVNDGFDDGAACKDGASGGGGRGDGKIDGGMKRQEYQDGVVTLGFIGYPNVGKSSVLNAIKGKKVVSVSQTPGHTKHLQTIFLTPTVKLCDCPGLVFPSVVPKALQVIAGIFPVSQVREPYSVVQYVAERMDLPALLNIRQPTDCNDDNDEHYQWSAYDICDAWATKCGFFTPKAARPDLYRAANNILRLAISGQIRLCFRPPEYSTNQVELKSDSEVVFLHDQLKARIRQTDGAGKCVEDGDQDDGDKNDDGDDNDSSDESAEDEEYGDGQNNDNKEL